MRKRPDLIKRNKSAKQRIAVSLAWKNKDTTSRRRKISLFIKERNKGNKYHWSGDSVGYFGLHAWVRKQLGKPKVCSNCNATFPKKIEWANKGHVYKRNLTDWLPLCTSCHRRYDNNNFQLP